MELPQVVLEEGRPRRVSASSMMSSWTRVAVWSISTTAPRRMRRVAGAAEGLGGEQQQQRADALAAAGDEVLGDVGDDFDVGGGLARELLLDGGEVVAEEVEDLFCGRDGEGAHSVIKSNSDVIGRCDGVEDRTDF